MWSVRILFLNLIYDKISLERHRYEIANMLKHNQCLEFLILTNVEIGATGAMSLGKALKENSSLRRLHIGHRVSINAHQDVDRTYPFQIGNHGMIALFSNHSLNLREIDLSCNGIGDEGILPLIELLDTN